MPDPSSPSAHLSRFAIAVAATGLALSALSMPPRGVAEEPPGGRQAEEAEPEFVRTTRDRRGELESLDTGIVRYSKQPGPTGEPPLEVDLVAAVHIGTADYYDMLNRLFKNYDCVLYELVAAENARVPKPGRKPTGAIGQAQHGLTSVLGLEFQLEKIDYTAENFVHADLSPKEFDAAMERRGESWWTMFGKLMEESLNARQPSGQDVSLGDLFGVFFGKNRDVRLRRIMATQFTDMDVLTSAFGGEEGSTLITDRNAAAIDVLRDEIKRGRRRIAIFYGAAHMPDFDQRLKKEFGLVPSESSWLEAWDLRMPTTR